MNIDLILKRYKAKRISQEKPNENRNNLYELNGRITCPSDKQCYRYFISKVNFFFHLYYNHQTVSWYVEYRYLPLLHTHSHSHIHIYHDLIYESFTFINHPHTDQAAWLSAPYGWCTYIFIYIDGESLVPGLL